MADPAPSTEKSSTDIQSRLSNIEAALELDERLSKIETNLGSRTKAATPPWWRNAKIITVLGAFLAAILPAVTAIDGILRNQRESQRLVLEQQDKIRQTYLDRVLKSGISEGEQQRIFGLLVKLKSDPEFQEWAIEEYNKATRKLEDLIKEKQTLEEQNKNLSDQIKLEKERGLSFVGKQTAQSKSKIQKLEGEIHQKSIEVSDLRERIGELNSLNENYNETYQVEFVSSPPGVMFYIWKHGRTRSELIATRTTPTTLNLRPGKYRIQNASPGLGAKEFSVLSDMVINVPETTGLNTND